MELLVKYNSTYTLRAFTMWIFSKTQTEMVQLIIFIMEDIMLFILTGLTEYRPPAILKVKEESYRILERNYVCNPNIILLFLLHPG